MVLLAAENKVLQGVAYLGVPFDFFGDISRAMQFADVEQRQHTDCVGGGFEPRIDSSGSVGLGIRANLCQVRIVRGHVRCGDRLERESEVRKAGSEGNVGREKGVEGVQRDRVLFRTLVSKSFPSSAPLLCSYQVTLEI